MNQYSTVAMKIRDLLLSPEIKSSKGIGSFELAGITVEGLAKSSVGYILQDWLEMLLESKGLYFRTPENSQESPDFFLSEKDDRELLELKAFDFEASASFDLANYEAYFDLIVDQPAHLDADYLIIAYKADENRHIVFQEVWLKKIWEISGPMRDFPIGVQKKRGVIYNLRPAKWYSARATKPFGNREAFLVALYWSLNLYKGAKAAEKWKINFETSSGIRIPI